MNKGLKLNVKSFLISLVLLVLIVLELFNLTTSVDEVLGVFAIFYLFLLFLEGKLTREDIISFLLLIGFIIIGCISSFLSNIKIPVFNILVDILSNIKIFVVFFSAKYIFSENKTREGICSFYSFVAKLYIISSFICSIISVFLDIGMSGTERFGLRHFNFIFEFAFQFTAISFFFLSIIISGNEKNKHIYSLLVIISVFLNLKGPSMIFSVLFIYLYYYYKNNKKISFKTIIPIIVILVVFGAYQLEVYLLNEDSPRAIMQKYSIITANRYFPFGSGFATYGSDMAAKNYSQLYVEYGFLKIWGLNLFYGNFLHDTGYLMYIAQTGYIGAALFGLFLFRIFNTINRNRKDRLIQCFLVSVFVQYIVYALGSATLASSQGMIGFISIALVLSSKFEKEREPKNYGKQ